MVLSYSTFSLCTIFKFQLTSGTLHLITPFAIIKSAFKRCLKSWMLALDDTCSQIMAGTQTILAKLLD